MWLVENSESDAMRVVYRMRGLLGDATEEFVETLDKKKEEDVDNEQVYRMAGVMCQCGGLEVCNYRDIYSTLATNLRLRYSPSIFIFVQSPH